MTRDWPIAVATHAIRDMIGTVPPGTFRSWDGFETFIEYAVSTGFDGIDIASSVFPLGRDDAWWRAFRVRTESAGLELASVNCLRSSLADQDYWHLGQARIKRAIEVAGLLGIPTVSVSLAVPPERLDANEYRQLASPPGSSVSATPADLGVTAHRLGELAERAGLAGTELVVELHHCSVADTAASVLDLLARVRAPLTANPDLVNELWAFDTVRTDWRDTLLALAPASSGIWHVKNCRQVTSAGASEFVDAPLDDGDIDYELATAIMDAAGFRGWVSIERSGPGDFPATAARGLAFLRTLDSTRNEGAAR